MAYYSYKRVRDILIKAGWLDKYGQPTDKERYGEESPSNDYNGDLWEMIADYIEESLEHERDEWKKSAEFNFEQYQDAANHMFELDEKHTQLVEAANYAHTAMQFDGEQGRKRCAKAISLLANALSK